MPDQLLPASISDALIVSSTPAHTSIVSGSNCIGSSGHSRLMMMLSKEEQLTSSHTSTVKVPSLTVISLVVSFVLHKTLAAVVVTSIMVSFYYELPKLDCEVSEIEDAIQVLGDEDIFDYSDIEPSLEMDVNADDDERVIYCYWTFHCEPMFNGAPRMDNIIEFDNRVNEIINSHKK